MAIAYDQNRAASYNYLAGVQIAQNDVADGEANLDKALALKPDYYGALIRKAHVFLRRGKNAEAAELLQRAKAIDPNKVAAQYLLGTIFLRRGDVNEAVREWEGAGKISYQGGYWSGFDFELEMGFNYFELMSEIDLQLATLYKKSHDNGLAAARISPLFDGRARDVFSTEFDKYARLAELFLAGTFNATRVPADLRN